MSTSLPGLETIYLIHLWNGGDYSDSYDAAVLWFPTRAEAESFKAELEEWIRTRKTWNAFGDPVTGPSGLRFDPSYGEGDWTVHSLAGLQNTTVSVVPLRRGTLSLGDLKLRRSLDGSQVEEA